MDEVPDCREYSLLFDEHIKKERVAIFAFSILATLLFLIGIALILLSLILRNQGNLWTEIAKLGTGFVSAGSSYIPVKEIVDRRVDLVPYYFVKKRLDNSETLSLAERQMNFELVKKYLEHGVG
jgi:hypothetical protein